MKNALMDSSIDWSQPRKESVSLKIGQQKLPKLKYKDKKKKKNPRTVGQHQKVQHVHNQNQEKKQNEEEMLEVIRTKKFPKFMMQTTDPGSSELLIFFLVSFFCQFLRGHKITNYNCSFVYFSFQKDQFCVIILTFSFQICADLGILNFLNI